MGRRRGKVSGTVIAVILIVAAAAWGQADPEISLAITDSAGTPLDAVSPDTNDPALGGADFLLVLRTSDAADLVTYAQEVFFDSGKVGYTGHLESGFAGGETLVNSSASEGGASAAVVVSAMDIAGSPGPRDLARLGFEVRENPTSGNVTAGDYVFTTAPYADLFASGIAHSFADAITFVTEETPFTPTPTMAATATPSPTEPVMTSTPTLTPSPTEPAETFTPTPSLSPTPVFTATPDADFNDDGIVDGDDLLILIRTMRQPASE